jgi:predicted alpha/beta-fold hydrolase
MEMMPGLIDDAGYETIKNFKDFDDRYTAPIHGFANAEDYWAKSSCRQFIPSIAIPTLLVSAQNDPFLTRECYPVEDAQQNPNFYLEMPESGGHMGFVEFNSDGQYWSERRAAAFLND